MIPAKHFDEICELAANDGREAARNGEKRDSCEWGRGTMFYDAWQDAFEHEEQRAQKRA